MDKDELFDKLEEAPKLRWTWETTCFVNLRFVEFCGDWSVRNSHLKEVANEDQD